MRVTIDANGRGAPKGISEWTDALRGQSSGEEIAVFHSTPLVRMFGSMGLDFAIRGTDVFHASPQTPCAPRRAKLTATIEDLNYSLTPELYSPAHIKTAKLFAGRILAAADGLIAVSEAARRDAIRILDIKPETITLIYPGVDAAFFDAQPTPRGRPYVLCTGDPEPRANFATLRDAWDALKPELRREYDLVTLHSDAVSPAEMPGLVAGAAVFAHVPFHEYFALPVAQAMAAQVAVMIANTSGMPEVGRDAAIMVDPHSPAAMTAALTQLLESESERAKLARYGRARAEKYRWERCATESLAFFHRVLGK